MSQEVGFCPLCGDHIQSDFCPVHGVPTLGRLSAGSRPSFDAGAILGGRYRVDQILHRGPQSWTLLGTDLAERRTVVIRTLPGQELARRSVLLQGLLGDARVVALAARRDMVPVLDFGVEAHAQLAFLVMAYVPGRSAQDLIAPGGAESRTTALFVELAETLLDGHDQVLLEEGFEPRHPGVPGLGAPQPGASNALVPVRQPGPMPVAAEPEVWVRAQPIADVEARGAPPPRRRRKKKRGLLSHDAKRRLMAIGTMCVGMAIALLYLVEDEHDGGGVVRRGPGYSGVEQGSQRPRSLGEASGQRVRGPVMISSHPAGAEVYAGVRKIGVTPVRVDRPGPGAKVELEVRKTGYSKSRVVVDQSSPEVVRVTLFGGVKSPMQDLLGGDQKQKRPRAAFDEE